MGFGSFVKSIASPVVSVAKKAVEVVKPVAEVVTNPAKQINILDNAFTGGQIAQTLDASSGGKYSEYANLGFGDFKEGAKLALPVLASAASGGALGGTNVGGMDLSFLDDISDNLGKFGIDLGGLAKNAFNGLAGGGGTAPASNYLGQTQKAIEANQYQTSSMIEGLKKNMLYIVGGVGALVLIIMLMRRK